MKIDVLLGLQWGDEGKGKAVDFLTPKYDIIARFQGGPNAGHTLEFNGKKHVLHTIPSGIFHPEKINIIGSGVVLDPQTFKAEAHEVINGGADLTNLLISEKAHLILPTHRLLDAAYEQAKGKNKIGSTLKGIGPTYTDKTARHGLRVGDILSPDFEKRYQTLRDAHLTILSQMNFATDALAEMEAAWLDSIDYLRTFKILAVEYELNNLLRNGKTALAEGAQGTLLDVDFGSYPFVTSSSTICAGACLGLGVSPRMIGDVYGIVKAYCTRVGSGPFPTELFDATGDKLRENGHEFGATTGRPRRCGWLDIPALKYAVMINGVNKLILTKADVLSGFETINVCTQYNVNGEHTEKMPSDSRLTPVPVYHQMKGWSEDISNITSFENLPQSLKDYVRFIEKHTGAEFSIVSVSPDRNKTIQL